MSTIAFNWLGGNPPSQDVYTTRRGESRYHTLRYWDGKDWWSVEWSGRRGGKPFTWPKGSRTRKPTSKYGPIDFHIRKINSPESPRSPALQDGEDVNPADCFLVAMQAD